jgi:hypothetical protein
MEQKTRARIFQDGYLWGRTYGEMSTADAQRKYPDYDSREIETYCQGTIDGQARDETRLHMLMTMCG